MNRRDSDGGRWSQRALRARAREGYTELGWPEPVSVASKGYAGSGGVWCFVARTTLEIVAMLTQLPGLKHWSARSVVYVGRSSQSIVGGPLRATWIVPSSEVEPVWRTTLSKVVVTDRRLGQFSLVDFGGHLAWVLTDEIDSVLA